MPAIGTSSDQYQPRDPALTTYRKNTAAPTLADAMAQRPADKARATTVERHRVEGHGGVQNPAARQAAHAVSRETTVPPKALQELYAPPTRVKRDHDDRFSMITGGTVDVRV